MSDDAKARASMLERIRAAATQSPRRATAASSSTAGAAEARDSAALVPSVGGGTRELASAFALGCEEAGGRVHFASDADGAREVAASLLLSARAGRVVVSPDAAGAPWDLEAHLQTTGIKTNTGVERLRERSGGSASWRKRRRHDAFSADAGVCVASFGLADTGTLVLGSSAANHRFDSLAPRISIVLLEESALVPGLSQLFDRLGAQRTFEQSSAVTFVRGPSRTADIELTLTIGVHGPRELHVVIVGPTFPATATETS
jgi:L-lactate dehydrogenase complex protein LldG